MPIQSERDPKNSLRFYMTLPEGEIEPFQTRAMTLNIITAEKLLAEVKKYMADRAARKIVDGTRGLKQHLPMGEHGDTKPYFVKRTKAGSVPTHYRVGIQITFVDPAHAQRFAKALRLA